MTIPPAAGLPPPELAAWLRLVQTPGVGLAAARRLLAAFGSPQDIFAVANPAAWAAVAGAEVASALAQPPCGLDRLVDATLAWLDGGADRHVLTLGDPRYPASLLQIADPPLLLHAQGHIGLLTRPAIAIVGTRHPTAQGLDHARAFSRALSQAGYVVVSGLALGIDGAAHAGALEGPGRTIAVTGTGLDQVYPRRHQALAQRIAAEGLVLSEYVLGTAPLPAHFPRRNRLIAGLSLGTLVVEAALQSGSLITARLAAEQGREVFAIPGSIHAPQARGCHALIRQGAKLVEQASDILEELPPLTMDPAGAPAPAETCAAGEPAPADVDEDPVLAAMGYDPVSLDALVARTGWPAAELSARLLDLELEGRVARLPGALFQRRARA